MNNVALFVTYTMLNPIVGGAFFRALRLAQEMARRGWDPVICNLGPWFYDPKIGAAKDTVRFVRLHLGNGNLTAKEARRQLEPLKPAVTIMGEGAFKVMEPFYAAAQSLDGPFIVLDQFYNHWLLPHTKGVDLVLMYALASFWRNELMLVPPYEITPPFIDEVTPKSQLPVPAQLHSRPWITLVAYDDYVRDRGLDLLARVAQPDPAFIAVTRDTRTCREAAAARGIDSSRLVLLPLQSDPAVFGLFGASSVTMVSNGFLQIMESLAMASPVIALDRGTGAGLSELNIDPRFKPWVSLQQPQADQLACIAAWLKESPFSDELRRRVACERYGTSYCANRIEAVYRHARRPQSRVRSVVHHVARAFVR